MKRLLQTTRATQTPKHTHTHTAHHTTLSPDAARRLCIPCARGFQVFVHARPVHVVLHQQVDVVRPLGAKGAVVAVCVWRRRRMGWGREQKDTTPPPPLSPTLTPMLPHINARNRDALTFRQRVLLVGARREDYGFVGRHKRQPRPPRPKHPTHTSKPAPTSCPAASTPTAGDPPGRPLPPLLLPPPPPRPPLPPSLCTKKRRRRQPLAAAAALRRRDAARAAADALDAEFASAERRLAAARRAATWAAARAGTAFTPPHTSPICPMMLCSRLRPYWTTAAGFRWLRRVRSGGRC